MKRKIMTGWVLGLLCICLCAAAAADMQIKMEAGEWTWEAGGTAAFRGTITTDGADIPGAVMELSVETRMEDSGEAVFSNLNGKNIKVKKRDARMEMDIAGGNAENTFEGEWYLPAEGTEGLAHATIRISITDAAGQKIGQAEMSVGEQSEAAEPIATGLVQKAEMLRNILLIAAGAVWLLAIGRHAILNRKKKTA